MHGGCRVYVQAWGGTAAGTHVPTALAARVPTIHFGISPYALEDRLTSLVAQVELPDAETDHLALLKQQMGQQQQWDHLEQAMLEAIRTSNALQILDSRDIYSVFVESQLAMGEVKRKQARVAQSQKRNAQLRGQLATGLAAHLTRLYGMLTALPSLDPACHFSLDAFLAVVQDSLRSCPR